MTTYAVQKAVNTLFRITQTYIKNLYNWYNLYNWRSWYVVTLMMGELGVQLVKFKLVQEGANLRNPLPGRAGYVTK